MLTSAFTVSSKLNLELQNPKNMQNAAATTRINGTNPHCPTIYNNIFRRRLLSKRIRQALYLNSHHFLKRIAEIEHVKMQNKCLAAAKAIGQFLTRPESLAAAIPITKEFSTGIKSSFIARAIQSCRINAISWHQQFLHPPHQSKHAGCRFRLIKKDLSNHLQSIYGPRLGFGSDLQTSGLVNVLNGTSNRPGRRSLQCRCRASWQTDSARAFLLEMTVTSSRDLQVFPRASD
jgi:hypothetical protein